MSHHSLLAAARLKELSEVVEAQVGHKYVHKDGCENYEMID